MYPVKVIHIITKLELGGAQENTLYTVGHLNPKKFSPELITGNKGILIEEAKGISSIDLTLIPELIREIRPLKDLKALFKIYRSLKKTVRGKNRRPVIVHTHSSKAGILGRWAARLAGVKIIIHSIHGFSFHDYQSRFTKLLFIFLERITSFVTRKFIAVSLSDIEKGVKYKIFSRNQIVLIRSGIDISQYQKPGKRPAEIYKELGLNPDFPLVGMIACLKPQKAPLDFLDVAFNVSQRIPETQFILAGDGELRDKMTDKIKSLKLENNFHLLGWRRDIPDVLSLLDVLVLTSLFEGLPRVFPQAMAAGVPVVATKVDGAPEAIREGINGFLLKPHDIKGMSEKIIYLIKNPEISRKMGEKGKEFLFEFDIKNMVKAQEELYIKLLQKEK
ncbi:MAG: glycosyltransferase family 4 protein [Thermodesulfobacteriota bacterium]|nr:glycosyltransferase family 4 protein [Thermodesulfobacteriota bacterium]